MIELGDRIQRILGDTSLDKGGDDVEAIENLIAECGWDAVQEYLLKVLQDDNQRSHWYTAAAVFWGAALDKRPVPVDKLIALLYYRFDPDGKNEDDLVWSITSELKGVEYLSDYSPLDDPGVQREFQALRNAA
jgi:hypothetical protein